MSGDRVLVGPPLGWCRCGMGDRTRIVRDPSAPPRWCRQDAAYEISAPDGYRNVCAEHLALAVDIALGRDSEGTR